MIIHYDGQQYPFDLDEVTVKQALKIEKFMGCSFADWGQRLQAGGDLRARQALGWLILHPDGLGAGGIAVPIEDTDFKMGALGKALDEAFRAEAGEEEASAQPVPTVAVSNGRTPAAAASSTESLQPSSDGISP